VPVGYLVLESETARTMAELQDLAIYRVRPIFGSLPGVSSPPPIGGNSRTIVVNVDPDRLRSYHLSLDDVISAVNSGNTITPSGNVRIHDQMPIVPVNAMVGDLRELGNIPLRPGQNVYLRDVSTVEDSSDIPTGFALVNGKRAVYLMVTKRADASTLAVVNAVKDNIEKMQEALPADVRLRFDFDQSPSVHPGGVPAGVLHGGGRPQHVRAPGAGGRLLHDHVVPALQHVRAGDLGVAPEE
jgi:multidrug efflux pump subunit AcrB